MKIALLGDIALFGKYDLIKNPNIFLYFSKVAAFLKSFDYVIGNFETPFTELKRSSVCKSAHIKTNPQNIEILKMLNISIVNLSNNHLFDYGAKGFESTIEVLERNHIKYFGVDGKDLIIDDTRVCLSGYCCYSTNATGYFTKKAKHGVNILNGFELEKKLIADKKNGLLSIVSVHCGDEHVHYPRLDHIKLARNMAQKADYVFYGHHPHVMQGIDEYMNSKIAYSLGNFCFDDVYTKESTEPKVSQSKDNKASFVLELEVTGKKVIGYKTTPIYDNGKEIVVDPRNEEILKNIKIYSEYLKINNDVYAQTRKMKLEDYYDSRKASRNFEFYRKRLNFNTIGILINKKINLHGYKKNIVKYLDENV